jgi:hypothetical protein
MLNKRFITYSYKRVKEERKILHTIKRKLANWIVYVLRRKCLLKYAIEGDMEGTGRRARRGKQLPDDLQENIRYLNLRGSIRSLSVKNSLWNWLWTCRKTHYVIIQFTSIQRILITCWFNSTNANCKATIRTKVQHKNRTNIKKETQNKTKGYK